MKCPRLPGQLNSFKHIKPLPTTERLRLITLIAHDMMTPDTSQQRSLLELEGLGAELWKGIDAQTYVNGLRQEWDQQKRP